MQLLISGILFFFSSGFVIIVDYFATSSRSFQKALVLPILFLIFALYRLPKILKNGFLNYEKLLFLFWGNVFIQMLILSTGGLQSPFFILFHLSLIGLSLLFSFSTGLMFFVCSMIVIVIDNAFHQTIITVFLENPGSILLEAISFIVILPVAFIVSYKYHGRDWLFSLLRAKVTTDETILEHLNELIIVTDLNLRIISVNNAAEQIFMQSRSELLYEPLLNVLILKDEKGKLVTKETFFHEETISPLKTDDTVFTLFQSGKQQKEVTVQIQPITDEEEHTNQISFIISYVQKNLSLQTESAYIIGEKARVRYEALMENLKNTLQGKQTADLLEKTMLIEKIENDIYHLHILQDQKAKTEASFIDLAKLCRKITLLEKDFAKTFNVSIDFTLRNFGMKDITPYLAGNFTISPEEFTGPFFTVSCDVKKVELIVKKLLDLCILLASTEKNPQISVSIEKGGKDEAIIYITSNCPFISEENKSDLFSPYYRNLYKQTNLHLGSGLEGYLIKTACEMINITLTTKIQNNASANILFTLPVKKNFTPAV